MDYDAIDYYAKLQNVGYNKTLKDNYKSGAAAAGDGSGSRSSSKSSEKLPPIKPHKVPEPFSQEEIQKLREQRKKGEKRVKSQGSAADRQESQLNSQIELGIEDPENIRDLEEFLRLYSGHVVYVPRELNVPDEDGNPRLAMGLANHIDIYENDKLMDLVPVRIPEKEPNIDAETQYRKRDYRVATSCSREKSVEMMSMYDDSDGEDPDAGKPSTSKDDDDTDDTRDRGFTLENAWVPTNKENLKSFSPVLVTDDFDIYIDQVRFVVDNCRLVKVLGKVTFSGVQIPDLTAYPEAKGSARCPTLKNSRLHCNKDRQQMSQTATVVIRIFAIDQVTMNLSFVGLTAKSIYRETSPGKIRLDSGAFQLRVYQSGIDKTKPTTEDSFPDPDCIPGLSILLRLQPHTDEPVEMPDYQSGVYRSNRCVPTDSERNLFKHYFDHVTFPVSMRQSAMHQFESDKNQVDSSQADRDEPFEIDLNTSNDRVQLYIQQRLDRKHWANQEHIGFIQLDRIYNYNPDFGVNIMIEQMLNVVAKAMYVNVVCTIVNATQRKPLVAYCTNKHDYSSFIHSQSWSKDKPAKVDILLDDKCKVIFYIVGLDPEYEADPNLSRPGVLRPRTYGVKKESSDVVFNLDSFIGWTMVDLISEQGQYTINGVTYQHISNGVHYLPIMKGNPPGNSRELRNTPAMQWINDKVKGNEVEFIDNRGLLKIHIFDGFFNSPDASPYWLEHGEILEEFGESEKLNFEQSLNSDQGPKLSSKVIATLPKKSQKEGTAAPEYKVAEDLFEQAMSSVFGRLVMTVFEAPDLIRL